MSPCLTHDVSHSGTVFNALDIPTGVECCRTAFSNCILVHFSGRLFPTTKVLLFRPLLDHELNRPTLRGNPFVHIEVTFLVSPAVRTPNPKSWQECICLFHHCTAITECHLITATDARVEEPEKSNASFPGYFFPLLLPTADV